MKFYVFFAFYFSFFCLSFSQNKPSNESYNNEMVYVQTDRPFYEAGEEVWYTIWLLDNKYQISNLSTHINVQLKDPKGNVIKSNFFFMPKNLIGGKFILPKKGGLYTVEVSTNLSENNQNNTLYKREIQVQDIQIVDFLMDINLDKNVYMRTDSILLSGAVKDAMGNLLIEKDILCHLYINGELYMSDTMVCNRKGEFKNCIQLNEIKDIQTASLQIDIEQMGLKTSKYKHIPLNENQFEIELFPEGGQLIHGFVNTVAYRAIDQYGKPIQVNGQLRDTSHLVLKTFNSLHDGMGTFQMIPNQYKHYLVDFWVENSDTFTYSLPKIQSQGVQINVLKNTESWLHLKINSNLKKDIILFIKKRNETIDYKRINNNDSLIKLNTDKYAMGIYDLVVVNNNYKIIGSRRVFINPHKKLNIDIQFYKKEYHTFETVKAKIQIKDHNNQAVEGLFTIAVVKEQMLQYSEKHRANILSDIYLLNDLNADVHLPGQYFEKTDSATLAKLDLLMLTHPVPVPTLFQSQNDTAFLNIQKNSQRMVIRGNILNRFDFENPHDYKKFIKNLELKILNNKQIVPVDSNGNFAIWGFNSSETIYFRATISNWYKTKFEIKPWLLNKDIRNNGNSVRYEDPAYKKLIELAEEKISTKLNNENQDIHFAEQNNTNEIIQLREHLKKSGGRNLSALSSTIHFYKNSIQSRGTRDGNNNVYIEYPDYNGPAMSKLGPSNHFYSTTLRCLAIYPTTNYIFGSTGPYNKGLHINDFGTYTTFTTNNFNNTVYYSHSRHIEFPESSNKQPLKFEANYMDMLLQTQEMGGKELHPYESYTNDKNNTILYLLNLKTNSSGKAELNFYNGEEQGAYSCQIESISSVGEIGSYSKKFNIKSAYYANINIPEKMTLGDQIVLPLTLQNNFNDTLKLEVVKSFNGDRTIELIVLNPFESKSIPYHFKATKTGTQYFQFTITYNKEVKSFNKQLRVVERARLYTEEFNGTMNGATIKKTFNIESILENEKVYITVSSEKTNTENLLASVENMIQQPSGCFEQVSSTNYPNILAYKLLRDNNRLSSFSNIVKYEKLLISGYEKLVAYETDESGFEWYGHTPPHEGLTAYGLLQFYELEELGIPVNQSMMERNTNWLFSRYKNDGSIQVNAGKYGFSGASVEVTSAYVSWVLTEIGYFIDSQKVAYVEKCYNKNKDLYIGALLTKIYFNNSEKEKGLSLLKELSNSIKKSNYRNLYANHSIVRSYGKSLDIEVLSMVLIDLIKQNIEPTEIDKIKDQIYQSHNSSGYFGNTQSTIWALKALIEFIKYNQSNYDNFQNTDIARSGESDLFKLIVNGDTLFQSTKYQPSFVDFIKYEQFKKGVNKIEIIVPYNIQYMYSVELNWRGLAPLSQKSIVTISCNSKNDSLKLGQTLIREYILQNTSSTGVGQTVCVLPIPAGVTLIPENLKMLNDKRVFDYYEIINGSLIVYFAEMGPKEKKIIPITFQTNFEGLFFTPIAHCYLYYNSENTYHMTSPKLTVKK